MPDMAQADPTLRSTPKGVDDGVFMRHRERMAALQKDDEMNKYTPGPWRYELYGDETDDMRHGILSGANDLWVAACYRSGTTAKDERSEEAEKEAEANARLIAAAPELLEVLKDIVFGTRLDKFNRNDDGLDCYGRDFEDREKAARAVIAKAEGGE